MTIGTAGARVTQNCDGVSKVFPVAIQAYLATDFNVILTSPAGVQTPLVLNSDYSMAPSGSLQPTAWTLTTLPVAAYPAGYTLQTFINPQQVQQTQYVQGQAFPSLAVQTNMDRLTQMVQRLEDQVGRAIHAPDGDVSPGMLLPVASARALTYPAFDANGNAIVVAALPGSNITQGSLGPVLYPQTAAEIAAAVVPTNYIYVEGDLRRYGALGNGVADDSAAWQAAINVGIARLPKGLSFKIVTPAVKVGQVTILGEGPASKLLSDASVLTVTSGTGSFVDNFWMENITAPYIVTRNPANWAAVITPVQSNGLGYQPTVNDPEYATWVAGQPLVGTQNIGPTINFTGAANHIKVTRIYGRFVRINIFDAINSSVEDCDFQGGKGTFAAVLFDNCTNNVQQGVNNKAINNRIYYASQCGITIIANDDFIFRGNHSFLNGQSGLQTAQTSGFLFTASVGGATSGTLIAPFTGPTASDYGMAFENGEVRTVTLTNGSTAVSWTPALPAGNLVQVSAWGHSSLFANSTRATISSRCQVVGNRTYQNYFDGLDFLSTFGTTNGAVRTYHQICDNHSYGNNGDGMNIDGQFGNVEGNTLYSNGRYGIWGVCQNTQIVGNANLDNNQLRNASVAEIQATGGPGNKIADNYMWGSSTQNCPAILTTGSALNYIMDNIVVGPAANNVGNTGSIAAVYEGNIDSVSGASTPQSFMLQIKNNGGTLQHIFYADLSATSAGLFDRINGATSGGFTNTPAGADSSTPMAAGIKIGSAIANAIWLDTAAQPPSKSAMIAAIIANSTGTALTLIPLLSAININGVTRTRLSFQIVNAATGAGFTLNTTNITAGKEIDIQFYGKLS